MKTTQARDFPPRRRLLDAAADLFYRHGIRAVGVEAIAEAAGTNKMTLYRHFASKDELVAEYLREAARNGEERWATLDRLHPADPRAQLRAWLKEIASHVATGDERGCPLANAAVELPDKDHPARRVVEACKIAENERVTALCEKAGLRDPQFLADQLGMLIEGARVTAQSIGAKGLEARMLRMAEALIEAHEPSDASPSGTPGD